MGETAANETPVSLARDRMAWLFGLAVFAVHAAFAGRYDLFRDELYFIVCGQRPAFGYADQPPLIPLAAAALWQPGWGPVGLRLLAALAAGLLPVATIRFVRLLDGGPLARWAAAFAVSFAPILFGVAAVLNTTLFEPLAWTLIALLLVRADRRGEPRALLLAGLVAGIAMEAKYALVLWAAGLAVGIAATPQRRLLARPALWGGLAIAALVAAPSLVWQAAHGFPFLELSQAAAAKNADIGPLAFLANQVFITNPVLAPLWIAGLAAPFVSAPLKDLRFLPIAWIIHLAIVLAGHGKDYYLAATYPALFAIGAVALAPLVRTTARKAAFAVLGLAATAVTALAAPMLVPMLPPAQLAAYLAATGLAPQQQEKSFAGTALPQIWADQLGWHDFAAQVSAAWARIPPQARARTAIRVDNYGEAAALDLYADLPPALSSHNQYWFWGARGQHPENLLIVTGAGENLRPYCRSVTMLGTTRSRWAMAYENGLQIALCGGLPPRFAARLPGPRAMR